VSWGDILRAAEVLATNDDRRVLLLLAIWVLRERDRAAAERIANMLPTNHAAIAWALGGAKGKFSDSLLDDLGEPLSVDQVLLFMRPTDQNAAERSQPSESAIRVRASDG
jgi:hypothetical protein